MRAPPLVILAYPFALPTLVFLLNYVSSYTSRGLYTRHRFSSLMLEAGRRPQGGQQAVVAAETRRTEGGVITVTTTVEG